MAGGAGLARASPGLISGTPCGCPSPAGGEHHGVWPPNQTNRQKQTKNPKHSNHRTGASDPLREGVFGRRVSSGRWWAGRSCWRGGACPFWTPCFGSCLWRWPGTPCSWAPGAWLWGATEPQGVVVSECIWSSRALGDLGAGGLYYIAHFFLLQNRYSALTVIIAVIKTKTWPSE